MFDFTEQVVMIPGAAGNLGIAVARRFQRTGANLVLVDRSEDHLKQIYPDLVNNSSYLFVNCADMTDPNAVKAAVDRSTDFFRRVDVLANVVGGYRAGYPLHETPLETWDFLINLNARSVFIISQMLIPIMLNQGSGKIISVGARPCWKGGKNMAAYSASKSAVIRLTESMSAELKSKNINVNCILPGTIDTPQNRSALPNADYSRWVSPDSIADVILFLSSDMARDIHGAAISVYGKS
jgi:NAD(P)-dependent dehydrogenase (short-subunit alcohol dehydrogenase family)